MEIKFPGYIATHVIAIVPKLVDNVRSCSQFTDLPILTSIAPYGRRGHLFILKDLDKFYAFYLNNINTKMANHKTANLRCRFNHRSRNRSCKVMLTLTITHFFDKSHPYFYHVENFQVNSRPRLCHTCEGYGSEMEAKFPTKNTDFRY